MQAIHLSHPFLPDEIKVSFEQLNKSKITHDFEQSENMWGTTLIRKMAKHFFGESNMKIQTKKNEKPRAFLNEKELSISFSHTENALSAALSQQYIVGCDMESVNRLVSPRIIQRMRESKESNELYQENDSIRLWTLKESALKMIGTGLRKPMNSIKIEQVKPDYFSVDFNDGKRAEICSFKHQEYWITICYKKN